MARSLHLLVALAVLLPSCTSTVFLEATEPPHEVRYMAALAFEPGTGLLVGSSDIVERAEVWHLELEYAEDSEAVDEAHVQLVGWPEALRPETLPAPTTLGRPRPAIGCDTRIPAPSWNAVLRGEAPTTWPSLSTDTLAKSCPTLLEPGASESLHLCGRNYCGQSIRQQGCQFEIRSAGCGLDRSVLLGSIDAYGQLCFDDGDGCRTQPAPPAAFRRIECSEPEQCTIDWLRPSPSSPPLRIHRRDLVSAVSPLPSVLIAQPNAGQHGPLQELLLSDAHLLVLERGDLPTNFGRGDYPSRLLSLDPTSLEIVSEVALPNGVAALDWAPDQQSLVGILLDRTSGEESILRISPEGEVLERNTLQLPLLGTYRLAQTFEYFEGLERFVAFFTDGAAAHAIVTFDPTTLQAQSACVPGFDFSPIDMRLASPEEIWITENSGDYLLRLSLADCRRTGAVRMDIPANYGMGFMLNWPEGSKRIFLTLGGISSNGVSEGELSDGLEFPSRGASFFESFMIPTQLAPDPLHPGLALASVHSSLGAESARVAWFDLGSKLFRVGSAEIGPGIVARMRTRGDGVHYLLMGRTGGVVRVDTR